MPVARLAMRIVADTNTIVSGILWGGPSRQLLDLARAQTLTLCTSAALIEELADVIAREKFARRLRLAQLSAKTILTDYLGIAELIVPEPLSVPVCRDPEDDQVLACAIAAKAEIIVTGDDDLLVLKEFGGVPILRSADAMQRIGGR